MEFAKTILFVGLAFSLAGCAHIVKLDPKAASVKLSSQPPPASTCKELGEVMGKSNGDDQEEAMGGARNDVKNRAFSLGGNFVHLEAPTTKRVLGTWKAASEILLVGHVFDCPQ